MANLAIIILLMNFRSFIKNTGIHNTPHIDEQSACRVKKLLHQNAFQANNSGG